jgi:hypothetical protein
VQQGNACYGREQQFTAVIPNLGRAHRSGAQNIKSGVCKNYGNDPKTEPPIDEIIYILAYFKKSIKSVVSSNYAVQISYD